MKQRVLLKGSDALDLLHRISSLDLKHIELNQKKQGLLLNPQGKILAYFEATAPSKDSLRVDFEDPFLEILEKYTFSEQYSIERLEPASSVAISEKERILNLTPKLGNEFHLDGQTNPLEVNLKSAISDQKGCYPGQEIIEKIVAIGSPPKKLVLVECSEKEILNLPLQLFNSSHQEVGKLTSFEEGVGLAILNRTSLKEGLELTHQNLKFTIRKVSS